MCGRDVAPILGGFERNLEAIHTSWGHWERHGRIRFPREAYPGTGLAVGEASTTSAARPVRGDRIVPG
ncbi:hypothetical protein GCM10010255_03430 [Streptomyces coeruleofuscus]|uniref:Uncharacterized protein n=1 Tax=Streptomyces coeruleofuscus TaxID=66879 RepID=A0ABN3HIL9_9ACTN